MFLTLAANAGSQPTGALHIIGQPITLTFTVVEISTVGVAQIPSVSTTHSQGFSNNRYDDVAPMILNGESLHAASVGKHNVTPFVCLIFQKNLRLTSLTELLAN